MRIPLLCVGALAMAAMTAPREARAQDAPENIPVTVTVGPNRAASVSGQAHAGGAKGQVAADWALSEVVPGNQELVVNGVRVGMRVRPSEEGRLTRVHVDAPDGTDLTLVIGFYDAIASPAALSTPRTYACTQCNTTVVCSVRPTCKQE
jgi:hypothetical protein